MAVAVLRASRHLWSWALVRALAWCSLGLAVACLAGRSWASKLVSAHAGTIKDLQASLQAERDAGAQLKSAHMRDVSAHTRYEIAMLTKKVHTEQARLAAANSTWSNRSEMVHEELRRAEQNLRALRKELAENTAARHRSQKTEEHLRSALQRADDQLAAMRALNQSHTAVLGLQATRLRAVHARLREHITAMQETQLALDATPHAATPEHEATAKAAGQQEMRKSPPAPTPLPRTSAATQSHNSRYEGCAHELGFHLAPRPAQKKSFQTCTLITPRQRRNETSDVLRLREWQASPQEPRTPTDRVPRSPLRPVPTMVLTAH